MKKSVRVTAAAFMAASALSLTACGAPTTADKAKAAATAAPAGSAVRDGKFEVQVLNVSKAQQASSPDGNQFMIAKPQGEFIILTLNVTNIGNEQQSFFSNNQKLIDGSGRQYGSSSEADMYLNSGGGSSFAEINPGNSIQAKVAFDVPVGTVPKALEVHDSMMSGGTTVALS